MIPEDASAATDEASHRNLSFGANTEGQESDGDTESAESQPSRTIAAAPQLAQRGGSDPWVVGGSRGAGPNNPDFDPWPTSPITKRFRYELHSRESSDRNYQPKGSKGLGRYQLTRIGLEESGMKDKNGNWTGKYGIRDEKGFLNDPLAQEKALADLMKSNEAQLRSNGSQRHIGKSIDGVKGKITVTIAGQLAAAHRMGAKKVAEYFNWIQGNAWTTKGGNLPPKLAVVETRLRLFEKIKYK